MSRRVALLLLSVIAAGLVLVLVTELAAGTGSRQPGTAPASRAAAVGEPLEPRPLAADPQLVTVLLSRPLFSPDRRPVREIQHVSTSGQVSSSLPRLAGILISGGDRRAVFQGSGDDKPIVIGEGDAVGGYTVKTIGSDAVIVTGGSGDETLSPKFDPNAALPAAPQMPAPPRLVQPGLTAMPGGSIAPMPRRINPAQGLPQPNSLRPGAPAGVAPIVRRIPQAPPGGNQ